MTDTKSISDLRGTGDVFSRIGDAMIAAGIDPVTPTIEQLAPVDHFHARGFAATTELTDVLPIKAGQRIADIGCGIGGPARFLAQCFGYIVDGLDVTAPFIDAANQLTTLVGMQGAARIEHGDGQNLPYPNETYDG